MNNPAPTPIPTPSVQEVKKKETSLNEGWIQFIWFIIVISGFIIYHNRKKIISYFTEFRNKYSKIKEEYNNWKFNDKQRFQRIYRVIKQK
mgnify:CR=1 FL=1